MGKYEKVCQNLRSMPKEREKVLIAIFAVQILFAVRMIVFWCAVQIFWCAGKKILSTQYKLLPPYGGSFAVFGHLMLNF
jgi:hypothetical protein